MLNVALNPGDAEDKDKFLSSVFNGRDRRTVSYYSNKYARRILPTGTKRVPKNTSITKEIMSDQSVEEKELQW